MLFSRTLHKKQNKQGKFTQNTIESISQKIGYDICGPFIVTIHMYNDNKRHSEAVVVAKIYAMC